MSDNRTRRRRVSLSRAAILAAAGDLIEHAGLDAFSLRKLAGQLGCEAMSLYHHFPAKADILDALVDETIARLPAADASLPPVARLRHLARAWRELALQQPAFFRYLALHRMNSLTGVRFLEGILTALHQAGLSEEQAARQFRVLNYFLIGAVLDESAGYASGPSARQPVDQATLQQGFPLLAAAGRYFTPAEFAATFELGLSLLLPDGP